MALADKVSFQATFEGMRTSQCRFHEALLGQCHYLWCEGRLVPETWLGLLPGLPLLDYTVGATNPIDDTLVYTVIPCAFGFLALTIVIGLAHDS